MPSSDVDTVYFERNITTERSPQILHSNQIMKNCLAANQLVPKAELQDLSLWTKFSDLQNEMVVTRGGRRMFPTFRVKLSDLYPDAMYCISMEIVNLDEYRYKYQNEKWTAIGRGEPHINSNTYIHPLSPCSGAELMKQNISFHKVKLTNSYGNASGAKINVYSLHKYQLHLHITRCDDMCNSEHQLISTAFSETTFITVTAYQNLEVIKLKIENNPFARGFRSNGRKLNNKRNFLTEEENILQELSMQQISGQASKRFMASVSEAHSPSSYQSIPHSVGFSNNSSTSLATQQLVSEAYSNVLPRDNSRRITKQVLFQQSSSASEQHPVAQQVTNFPSQPFDMSHAIQQHYISPMTQSIGSQNYGRLGYVLYSNAASEDLIDYSLALAKSSVSNANSYPNYGTSESYVHNSSSAAKVFANSSSDDPRSFVHNSSSGLEALSHCGTRCAERRFCQNSFTGSDAFFHMSTNVAEALPRR